MPCACEPRRSKQSDEDGVSLRGLGRRYCRRLSARSDLAKGAMSLCRGRDPDPLGCVQQGQALGPPTDAYLPCCRVGDTSLMAGNCACHASLLLAHVARLRSKAQSRHAVTSSTPLCYWSTSYFALPAGRGGTLGALPPSACINWIAVTGSSSS